MKLLIHHSQTSTAQLLKFGDRYVISTHAFHVGTKFKSMLVKLGLHYCDVIMGAIASQITSLTIVYSTVYSDADQRKHQSSASLAFVRGIHRGAVNSPHKWPVTRKMFPFDDVIMEMVLWWSYKHISLRCVMRQPWYASLLFADALAPTRHQAISKDNVDLLSQ